MLNCKHLAGATETSLYFITDKDDTVLITNGSERLHKLCRCCVETTFTLDRLNNNCRHIFGFNIHFKQGIKTCQ